MPALNRFSRNVRERPGEPLRSIYARPGLAEVTRASLDALRVFTQANHALDRGDPRAALEPVRADPSRIVEFHFGRMVAGLWEGRIGEARDHIEGASRARMKSCSSMV